MAAGEHRELSAIYLERDLDPALANQVATQLLSHDALGAHARDELGIDDLRRAHPIQSALTSAASFAAGAVLPILAAAVVPPMRLIPVVALASSWRRSAEWPRAPGVRR